ncbi:kelch-like protein 26 [Styela clava]
MAANFGIQDNEHNNLRMQKLDDMRKEKRLSDFTIKVGNKEFPVHKNVMSAGSDYFNAMLSHDNLESNTGIVDMKEVDVDSVKVCIGYIYTGNASITLEKSEQLLHVANIMQLSRFCEKISEFLKSNLGPKSFFIIRHIAVKFNLKDLEDSCDKYAVGHLGSIAKEEEFHQLDKDYVMFFITYKRSSYSEDSKLKVLLQWIKADIEFRAEHFIEMVKKLNIDKVSTSYGLYLARNDSFCSGSAVFMKLLYFSNKSLNKDEEVNVSLSSPISDEGVLLFDNNSKAVQVYCPIEETFNNLKQLNGNMLGAKYTAVFFKKFVFVLLPSRMVYRINAWETESTWTEMESMMNDHGEYIRAAVHNSFISFVEMAQWSDTITMITSGNRCEKVYKYSPSGGSWSSVKPVTVARWAPAAAVYGNRVYVAGGFCIKTNTPTSSTEFYDSECNTWTNMTSMTIPRVDFSLCIVNKNLFAVGHISGPYSIEKYDPDRNQWEKVTDLTDMEIVSAASIAAKIPLY